MDPASAADPQDIGFTRARRAGAIAGFVGAGLYLAAMGLIRTQLTVRTVPEVMQEGMVRLLPGALFAELIGILEFFAKPLLFLGILVGILLVGGLVGRIYGQVRNVSIQRGSPGDQAVEGVVLGLVLYVFLGVLWLPLWGAGLFGFGLTPDFQAAIAAHLLPCLAFGLGTALFAPFFDRQMTPLPTPDGPDQTRRRMIGWGVAGAAVVLAGGAWVLRGAFESTAAVATEAGSRLSRFITPIGAFYTISKNLFDPIVDGDTWQLEVTGTTTRTWTLEEIRALPATTQPATLMCIDNPVGGNLVGNGEWTGIPLRTLLEASGVPADAVDVRFTCADNYTDSISMEKALDPETRLVYLMNGEVLPAAHGFPARLIVPGIYGMKNVKWVTKIEPVPVDYRGFWASRGWDDRAPYKLFSRFDFPRAGDRVEGPVVPMGGIAFSGDRGISGVEVSADEGASWIPATLLEPVGPFTWQRWILDWRSPLPGPVTLQVRMRDGAGFLQTSTVTSPFPSGATGLHTIRITVG